MAGVLSQEKVIKKELTYLILIRFLYPLQKENLQINSQEIGIGKSEFVAKKHNAFNTNTIV